MTRSILLEALLFLVPFALYLSFLHLHEAGRRARAEGHPTPWLKLFAAGLILALAGLVGVGLSDRHHDIKDLYDPNREVPTRSLPSPATP